MTKKRVWSKYRYVSHLPQLQQIVLSSENAFFENRSVNYLLIELNADSSLAGTLLREAFKMGTALVMKFLKLWPSEEYSDLLGSHCCQYGLEMNGWG